MGAITRDGQRIAVHAIQREVDLLFATIPAGSALSDTVELLGGVIVGIIMPENWTAASLSFLAWDGLRGVFVPVYDDAGNEVTLSVTAGRAIVNASVLEKLAPLQDIVIRSGTAATPVNQAAERIITLSVKG